MKYKNTAAGIFLERPNRFIARVMVSGKEETVHVKNTGRCRELLVPGAQVFLEDHGDSMGTRKTRWDLFGVKKGELLINMDSQAPNKVVGEAIAEGRILLDGFDEAPEVLKAESTFGNSRFDFYAEGSGGKHRAYIEVKGVTLEDEGVARFPDAPTERGVKHIKELCLAKEKGYDACLIFVIQMKGVKQLEPNDRTHRVFGDALRRAERAGVKIRAFDCIVTEDGLQVDGEIPVVLETGTAD